MSHLGYFAVRPLLIIAINLKPQLGVLKRQQKLVNISGIQKISDRKSDKIFKTKN